MSQLNRQLKNSGTDTEAAGKVSSTMQVKDDRRQACLESCQLLNDEILEKYFYDDVSKHDDRVILEILMNKKQRIQVENQSQRDLSIFPFGKSNRSCEIMVE